MERIGCQMTEPFREPIFPPTAPIAVLLVPAGAAETERVAELPGTLTKLATMLPPGVCGATVMVWLGVAHQ